MTDFTWHGRQNPLLSGLAKIGEEISFYLGSLQGAIRAQNAYEDLSMMSDAELARRGLVRADLPAHVMKRYFPDQG